MARIAVIAISLMACHFMHASAGSDAAAIDAVPDPPIDSKLFDPATDCPATYAVTLPSSTSRYRIITDLMTFWPHDATCDADLPGRTHALVPNDMQEIVEISGQLDAQATITRVYIGGVQSSTATATNADWITFDGSPLLQTAWYAPEMEPDDGGDFIENQQAQLVIIDRTLPYLHDAAGISLYGIACECDGKPVDPTAAAYIAADPNHPP